MSVAECREAEVEKGVQASLIIDEWLWLAQN
jgi:hypothetical protein